MIFDNISTYINSLSLSPEINTLLVGIISGIVSSLIIYVLVFKIKPKIEISDQIAKSYNKDGKPIYKIKIINKSNFAIYNLHYTLDYCRESSDGNIYMTSIVTDKTPLIYISRDRRNDNNDKHAVRISYDIDEEKFPLDNDSYLIFTFIATHGFTNTNQYIEKVFYKNDIVEGSFETGNSLKVLVNNSSFEKANK